jgi:hypothetical protein
MRSTKKKRGRLATTSQAPHHNPSANWRRESEYKLGRHVLTPGTEVYVYGEDSRFRFYQAVWTDKGRHWLDFWEYEGGRSGRYRSFAPDRVRRIVRKGS